MWKFRVLMRKLTLPRIVTSIHKICRTQNIQSQSLWNLLCTIMKPLPLPCRRYFRFASLLTVPPPIFFFWSIAWGNPIMSWRTSYKITPCSEGLCTKIITSVCWFITAKIWGMCGSEFLTAFDQGRNDRVLNAAEFWTHFPTWTTGDYFYCLLNLLIKSRHQSCWRIDEIEMPENPRRLNLKTLRDWKGRMYLLCVTCPHPSPNPIASTNTMVRRQPHQYNL